MLPDFTEAQWTVICTSAVSAIGSAWMLVTSYFDKRRAADLAEKRAEWERADIERRADERERELQWERDDVIHKRKMEELQMAAVRAGNIAAKKADAAAVVASKSKDEVKDLLTASVEERRVQFEDVKQIVNEGIKVSNNYNAKITETAEQTKQLREDFQSSQPPTAQV